MYIVDFSLLIVKPVHCFIMEALDSKLYFLHLMICLCYCGFVPLQTCATVECWQLRCRVGLLEKGDSVILSVRSRLWAETFIEVRQEDTMVCSVAASY